MTRLRAIAARHALVAIALSLGAIVAGCSRGTGRGGAGVGEACVGDLDCAKGLSCASGTCALPPGAALCTPGTRVCDGPDVDQCDATGQGETFVQNCPNGCANGACLDPACVLGARRCASDGIEQCTSDASGVQSWQLVEPCPAGCDAATTTCNVLVCNPGAVRCDPADPDSTQTCATDGTMWNEAACPNGQVCTNGSCAVPACTPGAQRCSANGVESCVAVPNGPPDWQVVQECPLGCDATSLTCISLACKPLDVRCDPGAPNSVQVCAGDGSGWSADAPCASGTVCSAGTCVAQTCAPGTNSCDGNNLTTCNAQGTGLANTSACPHGCSAGACLQGACAPGSSQCASGAIQSCNPDGSGYTQSSMCPQGLCIQSGDSASCSVPVCTPLSRRCGTDGVSVQTCLADGSGWNSGDACSSGSTCSDGVCSAPPVACIEGALQCAGSSVQECVKGSWATIGACLGGCTAGGVCSGGSCGAQVAVTVALPACASTTCPPPADGLSILLAVAGPLVDSSGALLPDGTLVTVAATGTNIVSQDADPTTAGVQVRSVSGYADFSFVAPPASALSSGTAPITVTAQVGASTACAGSAQVSFSAAGSYYYAAEDFTRDADRDLANTTADWRTDLGVAESTTLNFGTGSDGPLDLSTFGTNITWDLVQTSRGGSGSSLPSYAPSVQVTGLGTTSAQVQGSVAGISSGDEIILIELQGASLTSSSAAGAWELLTVQSVADGQLTFTTPILGLYTSAPGAPLAGEKIAIQRVPQFTNVNVPAGSTLTATAWNGTLGGLVFFRANGTVTAAGSISADAIGYRAGSSSSPTVNQSGESYGGQPATNSLASARNEGAGGGGYLLCDPLHLDQLSSWYGAGGSYGTAGFAGSSDGTPSAAVMAGRAACLSAQGLPYGTPTLARLFPGSGSGTQQFNSKGACTTSTCPGESRGPGGNTNGLDYPVAFNSGSTCSTANQPGCAASFSFCSGETATYGSAYSAGVSSCTSAGSGCSSTFAQCGTLASTFAGTSLNLAHQAFNYANNVGCSTPACNDTRAYCTTSTSNYAAAHFENGASACDSAENSSCASTFASCSSYDLAYSASVCATGTSCSSTFTSGNCSRYTNSTSYAAAQHRPCSGNATCLNTFAACGTTGLTNYSSNTTQCVSACSSLGGNYSNNCSECGCYKSSPYACAVSTCESDGNGCDLVCLGGNCGGGGATGTFSGCSNKNNSCDADGNCGANEWCDDDCNIIGDNCNCHNICVRCWSGPAGAGSSACSNENCNSCTLCSGAAGTSCATNPNQSGCDSDCQTTVGCSTNPGCDTNPGCAINPGCDTNVGCSTNTGCDTCGGRTSWDMTAEPNGLAFCDFTKAGNTCSCPLPWQGVTQGGRGGGILFIAAQAIDLSGGGKVSSRGGAPGTNGFAGGSGGSLWVRAGTIKLAASGTQFDASGAANAGAGRIRLELASGTVPAAQITPVPYTPAFSLQQVQSLSILPAALGKKATSIQIIPLADPVASALIEGAPPLVTEAISSDGGKTFPTLAPGATDSFSSSSDLRFRVIFSPRPGPVARAAGLAWLIAVQ